MSFSLCSLDADIPRWASELAATQGRISNQLQHMGTQHGVRVSASQAGHEALEVLKREGRFHVGMSTNGGAAVFSQPEVQTARSFTVGQEAQFDLFLVPILERCFPHLTVLLSEEFKFLEVPTTCEASGFLALKPDLVILPNGFYMLKILNENTAKAAELAAAKKNNSAAVFRCGVPADRRLHQSTTVFESKVPPNKTGIPTAAHFGEGINYGACLRVDHLGKDWWGQKSTRVVLVTPSVFWLIEVCTGGYISGVTQWGWNTLGSLEALQRFVPSDPWSSLDALCKKLKVSLVDPQKDGETAFLGAGAHGRAFKVQDEAGKMQAMKVVCNQGDTAAVTNLQIELEVLNKVNAHHKDLVVCPTSSVETEGALAGFTMDTVGQAMTRGMLDRDIRIVKNVFTRLYALHHAGFTHGDTRLANLLLLGNAKMMWIDMRSGTQALGGARFTTDVRQLVHSILPNYSPIENYDEGLERAIQKYSPCLDGADRVADAVLAHMPSSSSFSSSSSSSSSSS